MDPLSLTRAPDFHHLPFPSRRSAVLGTGGVVATSQPLAALAGLTVMERGGNAFDAAVATAAALNVVEPTSTGMGGDVFALGYLAPSRGIVALNGSGRSGAGIDLDRLSKLVGGKGAMPTRGALTVTVPGAVQAWADLVSTHGRLSLAENLAPAIRLAQNGYPLTELIAQSWAASEALLAADPDARLHYLAAGRAPRAGEIVRLPALARSLLAVAEGGAEAFYSGEIATAIVKAVRAAGGFLQSEDLRTHRSSWTEAISTRFRDVMLWECPPNGQGLAALVALAALRGEPWNTAPWGSPAHVGSAIDAMRLGFEAASAWVADPDFAPAPLGRILSDAQARQGALDLTRRWANVDHPDSAHDAGRQPGGSASTPPLFPSGSDTVYVAVVDADGNACSMINSNYMGFGSGLVAGSTGIALQNRGAGFTLQPNHPNAYAPGKRPYHTIIPALLTRVPDQSLAACFGVMGGHMQPQGHLQVVLNMIAFGMDPQRALDAPRFQWLQNGRIALEPGFPTGLRRRLSHLGYDLIAAPRTPSAGSFGGGQLIAMTQDDVRVAGSDPRKDGVALAALPR